MYSRVTLDIVQNADLASSADAVGISLPVLCQKISTSMRGASTERRTSCRDEDLGFL